jgi:nucleotide-binding universal stress UspA family protein
MSRIVVGVDGSECSQRALIWAADEARRRGEKLEAVISYRSPSAWLGMGESFGTAVAPALTEDDFEHYARDALQQAVNDAGCTGLEVETVVVRGHASHVLVDASKGASMLVIGSRGHGDVASVLLGSVSLHCVHHAHCPVVVVRGETP